MMLPEINPASFFANASLFSSGYCREGGALEEVGENILPSGITAPLPLLHPVPGLGYAVLDATKTIDSFPALPSSGSA